MINFIAELFSFAPRQVWALEQIGVVLGDVVHRGFAATMAIVMELFSFIVADTPLTPYGDELDLTGYEIVFEDEFNGDALDTTLWAYRGLGANRGGYLAESQVTVEDGNLYLTGEYHEDGTYGAGWYGGALKLHEQYTYGYYEVKAICNDGPGYSSAFWLQSGNSYNPAVSLGGKGGAEVDILESLVWERNLSANKNTIHVAGIDGPDDEGIDSYHMPLFYTDNDMYSEYNTYGLMWTPEEYIFYINGVETMRTTYGLSHAPEDVILSLAVANKGSSGYNALEKQDKETTKQQFIVDYVRIYQIAE